MRQKALTWWRSLPEEEQISLAKKVLPNKSFPEIATSSLRIETIFNDIHDKENPPKQQMVLVPEGWLEGLLEYAKNLESANEDYEYGLSNVNDRIHLTTGLLRGYAMSAEAILKYNQRYEEPNWNKKQ